MTSEVRISAQLVKELRDKTGAPMMDCKSALTEAGGDLAQAEVVLRKRGIATAQKKAGRSAQEGLIGAAVRPQAAVAAMVEVNCESDFVARTEDFQDLLARTTELVAEHNPASLEALLDLAYPGGGSLRDAVGAKVGKLGENIVVRRFARFERDGHGWIGSYLHHGKIGVLVEVTSDRPAGDGLSEVAHDLAMHVAASDPRFVRREDVDPAALSQEREIQKERARAEGKPEKILEKIVEGRLGKFYEEICLLEQPFIRDTNISVGQWLASQSAKAGAVTVKRFTRYKVGEGVSA
jgi:elongation factor Ts